MVVDMFTRSAGYGYHGGTHHTTVIHHTTVVHHYHHSYSTYHSGYRTGSSAGTWLVVGLIVLAVVGFFAFRAWKRRTEAAARTPWGGPV